MKSQKNIFSGSEKGFTIIEIVIAMGIASIVMAAVFSIYKLQQEHYTAQTDITQMQQNIRAALNLISREIRMAGFDQYESGAAEIIQAKSDLLYFTVDLNEDGDTDDTGEHLAYDLYTDAGISKLGRTSADKEIKTADQGGGHWEVDPITGTDPVHEPIAENIEHLEFLYLDEDGKVIPAVPGDPASVYSVVITMVAKADQPDRRFTNLLTYTPASNMSLYVDTAIAGNTLSGTTWTGGGDHYRRRLETMFIQCRNIGL